MERSIIALVSAVLVGSAAAAGPSAVSPRTAAEDGAQGSTVAPEPSRWWDDVDRVQALLADGKWKRAERVAGELRDRVMSGGWREPDLGEVFAEIAFQLAIAAAERGDEERAIWEWHAALAQERHAGSARGGTPLSERDLSGSPRAEELFARHPLRRAGEYPPGHPPLEVRPVQSFQPATSPPFTPEPLVNSSATREAVPPVHFEVFVDPEGEVSQPVVTTPWSNPVVVQWGLEALRSSPRFEPAVLEGETVGWLAPVEISLSERAPKRW